MNSIFAKRRARLLAMKAIRDNYIPGDKLITCPKCGQESERKTVAEGLSVCPKCGYHNRWTSRGYRTVRDEHGHWHHYRPDGTEIGWRAETVVVAGT